MKLIVIAFAAGCGGEKKADPTPAPTPDAPHVSKDPPTAVPDTKPTAPDTSLKLPKRRILASDVIGKTSGQAVKAIGGKLIDGNRFDVEDAVIAVEFDETGKVGVMTIVADTNDETTTDEQRAVAEWAGAKSGEWLYDSTLREVSVWAPNARERSDERKRIGGILDGYLKRIGAGGGHARGDLNTVMLIRPPYGKPCNAGILATYRRELEETAETTLAKLGFVKMQCGLDGPSIPIR